MFNKAKERITKYKQEQKSKLQISTLLIKSRNVALAHNGEM
jgi:hypothetical protein